MLGMTSRRTFADLLRRDGNSFGLLRFLLAATVIVSHARTLGACGGEALADGTVVTAGRLAVYGFFAVSGFLVTHSCAAGGSLVRFCLARALRILPGYYACLLVTAFGLAVLQRLAERGDLAGAWDDGVRFVAANAWLRIRALAIGDLLQQHPLPDVWIGSLWSLVYEFRCYVLVAAFGALGVFRRARALVAVAWLASLAVFVVEECAPGTLQPWSPVWIDPRMVEVAPHFLFGSVAWCWRDRLADSGAAALALSAAMAATLLAAPAWFAVAATVALPYVVLASSSRLPWRGFDRRFDLSYGVYLYGFQVQQLLVTAGVHRCGFVVYAAASLLATLPFAFASWFLVERPALRWKRRPRPDAPTATA